MNCTTRPGRPPVAGEGCVLDVGSLYAEVEELVDERKATGKRYSLALVLLSVVLAELRGEDHPSGIAEWARARVDYLVAALQLSYRRMASHNTYRWILRVVDLGALQPVVRRVLTAMGRTGDSVLVAMDGKRLRGTLPAGQSQGAHLLAVVVPHETLVLMQVTVDGKENECSWYPKREPVSRILMIERGLSRTSADASAFAHYRHLRPTHEDHQTYSKRRGHPPTAQEAKATPRPHSARQGSWLFVSPLDRLTDEERTQVEFLCQASSDALTGYKLGQWFAQIARDKNADTLGPWLNDAQSSGLPDLERYAAGIRRDAAAVTAGLSLPWSNAQTEGQVNQLKLIKRQMYGRASFDLLRQRPLAARVAGNCTPIATVRESPVSPHIDGPIWANVTGPVSSVDDIVLPWGRPLFSPRRAWRDSRFVPVIECPRIGNIHIGGHDVQGPLAATAASAAGLHRGGVERHAGRNPPCRGREEQEDGTVELPW